MVPSTPSPWSIVPWSRAASPPRLLGELAPSSFPCPLHHGGVRIPLPSPAQPSPGIFPAFSAGAASLVRAPRPGMRLCLRSRRGAWERGRGLEAATLRAPNKSLF